MTTKPNKRVIKRWVEALRSGKYKQGRDVLKTHNNRFCCLGVLCDLHSRTKRGAEWVETLQGELAYLGEPHTLPVEVSVWAGLSGDDVQVTFKRQKFNVSLLNDTGTRFTTIANAIEREFLGGDK